MLLRWDKRFISGRTRRTKNFVRLHVLFNTVVYTYDMEVDIYSRTLVCFETDISSCQSSRILTHSLSAGTVVFKRQTITTATSNNKKALCKAKPGRVIAPVCGGQTIRKNTEWGLEIFERHDWIFIIVSPRLVSALVLR